MDAYDIIMQAYKDGYEGSISDLIAQEMEAQQQGIDVATTQQEAETGLLEGPPRNMLIPNAESITTEGMNYPINITTIDQDTGLVDSYMPNVQPGELVNTGKGVDVLETPSLQTGGHISSGVRERLEKLKCGGWK